MSIVQGKNSTPKNLKAATCQGGGAKSYRQGGGTCRRAAANTNLQGL